MDIRTFIQDVFVSPRGHVRVHQTTTEATMPLTITKSIYKGEAISAFPPSSYVAEVGFRPRSKDIFSIYFIP